MCTNESVMEWEQAQERIYEQAVNVDTKDHPPPSGWELEQRRCETLKLSSQVQEICSGRYIDPTKIIFVIIKGTVQRKLRWVKSSTDYQCSVWPLDIFLKFKGTLSFTKKKNFSGLIQKNMAYPFPWGSHCK
jgi:hypothetical protein